MAKKSTNTPKPNRKVWVLVSLMLGVLAGYFFPLSLITKETKPATPGSGSYTECAFNPGKACTELIIREIKKAKREIYFFLYSFKSQAIGDAIIEARERGVKVCGIVDNDEYEKGRASQVNRLQKNGAYVVLDARSGKAHNKYTVIDGKNTLTGSFNYDDGNAEQSYNDVICRHNDKEFSQTYMTNWLENQSKITAYENKKKKRQA